MRADLGFFHSPIALPQVQKKAYQLPNVRRPNLLTRYSAGSTKQIHTLQVVLIRIPAVTWWALLLDLAWLNKAASNQAVASTQAVVLPNRFPERCGDDCLPAARGSGLKNVFRQSIKGQCRRYEWAADMWQWISDILGSLCDLKVKRYLRAAPASSANIVFWHGSEPIQFRQVHLLECMIIQ